MKAAYILIILFASSMLFAQEGLVKSYFPNDTLKSEINYVRNVRDGNAKFYYENGNLKEEVTYVNGKIEGLVKQYDENGTLKELFTIEEGKRQGPTSYYDDKGTWTGDKDFEKGVRVVEKEPEPEVNTGTDETAVKENSVNNAHAENGKIKKTENRMVPPVVKEENFDDDPAYYLSAEVMPEPREGMTVLQKKLIYPSYAKENEIEGTVEIRAFIDQNGDVTKAEVEKGIGYGCDEAARITVLYTKFKPGLIRGKPVKIQMIIPLEFKLDKEDQ
jgi:TonB family protein